MPLASHAWQPVAAAKQYASVLRFCVVAAAFADHAQSPALQEATSGGSSPGRVLIHCSQGVSRSATLAIAYLMWKRAAGYDDVFQEVKAARGVANPNIGFICQVGTAWGISMGSVKDGACHACITLGRLLLCVGKAGHARSSANFRSAWLSPPVAPFDA